MNTLSLICMDVPSAKENGLPITLYWQAIEFHGAVGRNRTGDLLITNQLLYQLSYNSMGDGL